jgi:hypothetical protein
MKIFFVVVVFLVVVLSMFFITNSILKSHKYVLPFYTIVSMIYLIVGQIVTSHLMGEVSSKTSGLGLQELFGFLLFYFGIFFSAIIGVVTRLKKPDYRNEYIKSVFVIGIIFVIYTQLA